MTTLFSNIAQYSQHLWPPLSSPFRLRRTSLVCKPTTQTTWAIQQRLRGPRRRFANWRCCCNLNLLNGHGHRNKTEIYSDSMPSLRNFICVSTPSYTNLPWNSPSYPFLSRITTNYPVLPPVTLSFDELPRVTQSNPTHYSPIYLELSQVYRYYCTTTTTKIYTPWWWYLDPLARA